MYEQVTKLFYIFILCMYACMYRSNRLYIVIIYWTIKYQSGMVHDLNPFYNDTRIVAKILSQIIDMYLYLYQ